MGRGCSSVGRASDQCTSEAGSITWCSKGFFSPESTFSADSYGVQTAPCATAHIRIFVHIVDPVVHVRAQYIMETLKHPACTIG